MASPLFSNFERALRNQARANFRRSDFGQAVTELQKLRKGVSPSRGQRSTLARKLSKVKDLGLTDILMKTEVGREIGEIARYAKADAGIGRFIMDRVFSGLGPLGSVLRSLLRPSGRATAPSLQAELDAAKTLLESFGYNVEKPGGGPPKRGGTRQQRAQSTIESIAGQVAPPEEAIPETVRQRLADPVEVPERPEWMTPRDGRIRLKVGGQTMNLRENDPLLTGEMLDVESSNVHSIGFIWNMDTPTKGTLKVRFLQKSKGGKGTGAGPLYVYYGVHPLVFQTFQRARSKGKFVWDRLRIRGTVSGHQYQYELAGISEGYVPRKASRFGQNEYFIKRQVRTRSGNTLESQLEDRRVGRARPQRPSFGLPNRAEPNRGAPNRGR